LANVQQPIAEVSLSYFTTTYDNAAITRLQICPTVIIRQTDWTPSARKIDPWIASTNHISEAGRGRSSQCRAHQPDSECSRGWKYTAWSQSIQCSSNSDRSTQV